MSVRHYVCQVCGRDNITTPHGFRSHTGSQACQDLRAMAQRVAKERYRRDCKRRAEMRRICANDESLAAKLNEEQHKLAVAENAAEKGALEEISALVGY